MRDFFESIKNFASQNMDIYRVKQTAKELSIYCACKGTLTYAHNIAGTYPTFLTCTAMSMYSIAHYNWMGINNIRTFANAVINLDDAIIDPINILNTLCETVEITGASAAGGLAATYCIGMGMKALSI